MKKSAVTVGCFVFAMLLFAFAQNSYAGRFLSVAVGQGKCSFDPDLQKRTQTNLELDGYQKLANLLLKFDDNDIKKALNTGELKEVEYHE